MAKAAKRMPNGACSCGGGCPKCSTIGEPSPRDPRNASRGTPPGRAGITAVPRVVRARDNGTARGNPYPEVRRRIQEQGSIVRPEHAAWIMMPIALAEVQEVAVVLSLDVHSKGKNVREIARGGIEHVDVLIPIGIRAVAMDASTWGILAHNHPSGEARPSSADVALWHAARQQFACAGMVLCDHLVLGHDEFYSCLWGARWRFGGAGR